MKNSEPTPKGLRKILIPYFFIMRIPQKFNNILIILNIEFYNFIKY